MAISRQLFGYNRNEVKKRLRMFESEAKQSAYALEGARARIAQLEADAEEFRITIDFLRRSLAQQAIGSQEGEPVVIMVGPSETLTPITPIIDALETLPDLLPQFRVYRDGFYRLDGLAGNKSGVIDLLKARSDVGQVAWQGEAVYVQPKRRVQA